MTFGEIDPWWQEIFDTAAEPPAHVSPTQAPVIRVSPVLVNAKSLRSSTRANGTYLLLHGLAYLLEIAYSGMHTRPLTLYV